MKEAKAFIGKSPFLGLSKWFDNANNAPLLYGAVVQANWALWEPARCYSAGLVIVFALDEKHKHDVKFLKDVAAQISTLKKKQELPEDMKKLISDLRNDRSVFSYKVGASVAGDADCYCATTVIKDSKTLPKNFLPNEKIIPFITAKNITEKRIIDIKIISGDLYKAS
jgi:hypothetical protein